MPAVRSGRGGAPLLAWQFVTVRGPSMTPTLRDGDGVVVRRGARVQPADVVLARFRSMPDRLVLKRVARAEQDGWWLGSDNSVAGGDSTTHGVADVLGRVVLRTRPVAQRARWLCLPRRVRSLPRPADVPDFEAGTSPEQLTIARRNLARMPRVDPAHHREREQVVGFDPDSPVFRAHVGGKLTVRSTMPLSDRESLSLAYTPGVAEVSSAIAADESLAREYTWRSRLVAIVSDGTAVLGLGNIGPAAALPVMEGKAALFREFAGLNAVPIVLSTTDPEEIVDTVERIAPSFGGINLEDISAPRCFDIEARLRERLDIPVFHDDQHGTAIVVLAALRNAAIVTGRTLGELRVVVSGAGAAGVACTKILLAAGIGDIAVADSRGVVHTGRAELPAVKAELAASTNRLCLTGSLDDALVGADVFLGLSAGAVGEAAVATMAPNALIFALANPNPEVEPAVAHRYASVVATGRSDYPNQINNVLAFPGVFAGAFDVAATTITENMKLAAAQALSDVVAGDLSPTYIVPSPFDPRVGPAVSAAVAAQAVRDGVSRQPAAG